MTNKVLKKQLTEAYRRRDKLGRQINHKLVMMNALNKYINDVESVLGIKPESKETKGEETCVMTL